MKHVNKFFGLWDLSNQSFTQPILLGHFTMFTFGTIPLPPLRVEVLNGCPLRTFLTSILYLIYSWGSLPSLLPTLFVLAARMTFSLAPSQQPLFTRHLSSSFALLWRWATAVAYLFIHDA